MEQCIFLMSASRINYITSILKIRLWEKKAKPLNNVQGQLTSWSLIAFICSSFLAQQRASSSGMSGEKSTPHPQSASSTLLQLRQFLSRVSGTFKFLCPLLIYLSEAVIKPSGFCARNLGCTSWNISQDHVGLRAGWLGDRLWGGTQHFSHLFHLPSVVRDIGNGPLLYEPQSRQPY